MVVGGDYDLDTSSTEDLGFSLAAGDLNGNDQFADVVVSSLDPKLTFLKLVDTTLLPQEFVDSIRKYRIRGSSGWSAR